MDCLEHGLPYDGNLIFASNDRGFFQHFQVGRTVKFDYKNRCHEPCLLGYIAYDVIGHWSLMACIEMTKLSWPPSCKKCGCSFTHHMTIYYDTKVVETVINKVVESELLDEEKQRKKIQDMFESMKQEKLELEQEKDYISERAAKFAYFLQNNAITAAFDYFRAYIFLSLQRQKSLGDLTNMETVESLNEIFAKHDNLMHELENKSSVVKDTEVTEESIYKDAEKLLKLKHTGPKIKEIFNARTACSPKGFKEQFKTIVAQQIPKWFVKR